MHYGSIHNPRTKEGKLFAYLTDPAHIGHWQDAFDLACYLDRTTCLHTYVHGIRAQVGGTEYGIEHWSPRKGENYYRVVRMVVEANGQMGWAV